VTGPKELDLPDGVSCILLGGERIDGSGRKMPGGMESMVVVCTPTGVIRTDISG
jgi:hypothetical protein